MKSNGAALSIALVSGFLVTLILLPYFQKRSLTVIVSESGGNLADMALSKKLRVLQGGKTKSISLADLLDGSGTIILNFWATWCPPCIEELPSLEYLHRQIKGPTMPILATVSVDERGEDVWGLFETLSFKPSFLVLHDPDGEVARSFGATKFPETFWVKTNGFVLKRWAGPQDWLSADVLTQFRLLMGKS